MKKFTTTLFTFTFAMCVYGQTGVEVYIEQTGSDNILELAIQEDGGYAEDNVSYIEQVGRVSWVNMQQAIS